MVNSGSLESERNGNAKVSCMQTNSLHTKLSSSPISASNAKTDFTEEVETMQYCGIPALSEKDFNDHKKNGDYRGAQHLNCLRPKGTKSLFCSFPIEKVQTVLSEYVAFDTDKIKVHQVLCLFCGEGFSSVTLRQQHVAKNHSSNLKQNACPAELRSITSSQELSSDCQKLHNSFNPSLWVKMEENEEKMSLRVTRQKQKMNKGKLINGNAGSMFGESSKTRNIKSLGSKKLSVKSSRMILKRSKRLQAKLNSTTKKKRTRECKQKKRNERLDQTFTSKLNDKSTTNFANPFPEFDNFFQVKKITDHSIDNLKISSLTFDDVFDKAFFSRIKCNIQENLLHHIDGKLFNNEESESRISNFEKISNIPQETQQLNTENFGCEISLNAVAPTTLLLSNQLGDDPESQIEYGSKPSKKKTHFKKDEFHYKYFTRRKYQASILEHKENRDLSKLDMWTQYVIKNRQQKVLNGKKSSKEILDYFAGEEYKNMMKREELNRILDRRGPFEDLREEVSKRAALDKLNGENNSLNNDHFTEIEELLNDILNKVFELTKESSFHTLSKNVNQIDETAGPEIPSYLNLRSSTDVVSEDEIDRSDKIALICSSQETENFELPGNTVRGKNEKVELTGEWARSRIFVCAACGHKLQNIKQFLEHKTTSHQYIWVQHYEFVGNQSELYRHLSIPILGKVGVLENIVQCKMWRRSDARSCSKCDKQCNSLGELHRHILECGGDWTWMLARKKCKYRPFGAKSRRKRRGLIKRIYSQKTEPSEKKKYKRAYLPKQKPSDADTIKRMLANLPPKRATRKIICLKDGFTSSRSRQQKTTKQSKFKCGKLIRRKAKEQKKTSVKTEYEKVDNSQTHNYRRSLRCLNKVLTSRILDTNASLIVKRKYNRKVKNKQKKKSVSKTNNDVITSALEKYRRNTSPKKVIKNNNSAKTQFNNDRQIKEVLKFKRSSARIEKRSEFSSGVEKINLKNIFPLKKKKKKVAPTENINHNVKKKSASKASDDSGTSKSRELVNPPTQIPNNQLNNINLRKRRVENHETNIPKPKKMYRCLRNNKKRKLRNSLMNTVDEVSINKSNCQSEINNFFVQCETIKPANSQASDTVESRDADASNGTQNTCNFNDPVDDDKHTAQSGLQIMATVEQKIENEDVKPHSIPFHHSTSKKKKRNSGRGLNDCIAMLTSKLCKNVEESATQSICSEEMSSQVSLENSQNVSSGSEYILKVPLFNEHFQLCAIDKQSEYSDINKVGNYECNAYADSEKSFAIETFPPTESLALNSSSTVMNDSEFPEVNRDFISEQKRENKQIIEEKSINENLSSTCKDYASDLDFDCITSSDIVCDSNILTDESEKPITNVLPEEENLKHVDLMLTCNDKDATIEVLRQDTCDTDSEDEIPLSSLLNSESHCGNISSLTNTSENQLIELQKVCEDMFDNDESAQVSEISSSEKICEDESIPQPERNTISPGILEESVWHPNTEFLDESVNLSEIKEAAVLNKINNHFCAINMNASTTGHLENDKVDNELSCHVTRNELLDVSPEITDTVTSNFLKYPHVDNSISLSTRNDNDYSLKSENSNSITQDIVDIVSWDDIVGHGVISDQPLATVDCNINIDKRNRKDNSEYKENSSLLLEMEGKRKLRKKSTTRKALATNKSSGNPSEHHPQESIKSQNDIDSGNTIRNVETKVSESLLGDVLPELSENEFLSTVDNMNSSISKRTDTSKRSTKKKNKHNGHKSKLEPSKFDTSCVDTGITCNSKENSVTKLTDDRSFEGAAEVCEQDTVSEKLKQDGESAKDLRRSLRNSKRVTSYNETDLIDPIFDDLDSDRTISKIIQETTKDIFGLKRKSRKLLLHKKSMKNGDSDKKVSGEDLFDLLKTSKDNILSKPTNTFLNTFDDISNEFNDDNFDTFEHVLEKSIAVIEEDLSEKVEPSSNEIVESNVKITDNICPDSDIKTLQEPKRKKIKCRSKKHKAKNKNNNRLQCSPVLSSDLPEMPEILRNSESECVPNSNDPPIPTSDDYSKIVNKSEVVKASNGDKTKVIYCEICDKYFSRLESLNKHKRTLTHISKLSELEAREAALKRTCDDFNTKEEIQTMDITPDSGRDTNLLNMLGNINEEAPEHFPSLFSGNITNSNLQLADIINDALDKPVSDKDDDSHVFAKMMAQVEKDTQHDGEIRRCKNLAERKSFDSKDCFTTEETSHNVKTTDHFEDGMSSAVAGTILETQITLLENIIENRSSLDYTDDRSVSSSPTVNENIASETETDTVSKELNCSAASTLKENIEENFAKPLDQKEHSDDSSLQTYRKALNRDEKLFIECCSLLKSSSDVSGYSKKSNNVSKDLSNSESKPSNNKERLESNTLSHKDNGDFVECYSEGSGITTPLGDSFTQEESNCASQWAMTNSLISNKDLWKKKLNIRRNNVSFEEILNSKFNDIALYKENRIEFRTIVSSFDRVLTEVLSSELNTSIGDNSKKSNEATSDCSTDHEEDPIIVNGRKVLTKGAMKIFEGLKVSIPTEELSIDKILTTTSARKTPDISAYNDKDLINEDARNHDNTTISVQLINRKFTVKSKANDILQESALKKQNNMTMNSKVHDVYDFEETQDNSDVFPKPDFRSFRTSYEKCKKLDKPECSDDDSQDCMDAFSFDALSSSTSSVPEALPIKPKDQYNITKKKCMIMGRIFKNAVKSRVADEDIRNIPVIDNTKLVQDFVLSCPEPTNAEDKRPRLTEEEMNLVFDKLITDESLNIQQTSPTTCASSQTNFSKRKRKTRNKKRSSVDSSDDEFKLQTHSKKRPKKKSNNSEESCINLEQELRECIGVASRKSQRKCTSGKQNVLIEYWSSDESSVETIFERQFADSYQDNCRYDNTSNENSDQNWHHKDVEITPTTVNYESAIQPLNTEFTHKRTKAPQPANGVRRRKRVAPNPLYHWSSSSEDESRDLIEIRPARDEFENDEDRPVQHGWIVGDSPKKLVTMLAQAKGKKWDIASVKEHSKKRTNTLS